MDVGMMMAFASYGWENIGDDQVWDEVLQSWTAETIASAAAE